MNYNRVNSQIGRGWLSRVHEGQLPLLSRDQLKASRYLKKRKIFELLNFLLGHLLCDSPADPMRHLEGLLDRCLRYRWGVDEPPLLFTPAHVEAMFKAFDPGETEVISVQQYMTAMTTLGICTHAQEPTLDDDGRVTKETFCREADRCLMAMLDEVVSLPAGKGGDTASTGSCAIPPPPPPTPVSADHSLESVPEEVGEVEEVEEVEVVEEVHVSHVDDAEKEAMSRFLMGLMGWDEDPVQDHVQDEDLFQDAVDDEELWENDGYEGDELE